MAYVFAYTCGCVTKHFNDFNILFVGRVFSGVATSLLYSAFESWLVAEHKKVLVLTLLLERCHFHSARIKRNLWVLYVAPLQCHLGQLAGFANVLGSEGILGRDWAPLGVGSFRTGLASWLLRLGWQSECNLSVQRGYDEDWLGGTFSQAVFVGNGLMAILSGFLAHTLVEGLNLGPVAPFDAAHVVLLLGGAVVLATWTENFGDESREQNSSLASQIGTALQAIRRGELILLQNTDPDRPLFASQWR